MEYGHEDNAFAMNTYLVMPLDPSEHARSPQDLMTRRLKNRERQRRYRARKRLEAEKKTSVSSLSTPPQMQLQLPELSNTCSKRVHCQRNWKKDARRAHVYKEDVNKSSGQLNTTLVIGGQMPYILSGVDEQLSLESEIQSIETPKSTLSRRHWKVEARKKKI